MRLAGDRWWISSQMAETPAAISSGVFSDVVRADHQDHDLWRDVFELAVAQPPQDVLRAVPAVAEINDAARREEPIPDVRRSPATADVLAAGFATPEVHDGIAQHDDLGLTRLHQRDRGRVARRPVIDAPVPSLRHGHERRRDARARRARCPFERCPDRRMVRRERTRFDRVPSGHVDRCEPHAGVPGRIRAVERVAHDGLRRRVRDLQQTIGARPNRLGRHSRGGKRDRECERAHDRVRRDLTGPPTLDGTCRPGLENRSLTVRFPFAGRSLL